jgi:hypothetical protein
MLPATNRRQCARARALHAGLITLALVCAGAAASDGANAQVAGLTVAQADPAKEGRLHELKALYDKGLISRSVFLDEQRRILRGEPPAPAAVSAPAPAVAPGAGGLRAGYRWEYAVVDSSGGLPFKRLFEIEQASDSSIVERVVMEDGSTRTAQHRKGAYLDMSGGMQFSPYYFAFKLVPDVGPIRDVKVENGDPCAYGTKNTYNTYDCEVVVKFEGEEVVSVPAGNFAAQVVRVEITQIIWGFTTGQRSRSIAFGRFWLAPKAGRLVKASVTYRGSRTERMELISTNVALAR